MIHGARSRHSASYKLERRMNDFFFFLLFRSNRELPNNLAAIFKIVSGEIEIKIIENTRKVLRIAIGNRKK